MSRFRLRILRLLICGISATFGVIGAHWIRWAVADDCVKPNPSQGLCDTLPSDAVTSCTGLTPCDGSVYEINNFPKGTTQAETGATKEEQANCKRVTPCDYDTSVNPAVCKAGITGNWSLKAKTVNDPDTKCESD